jgi:hypothetical protein
MTVEVSNFSPVNGKTKAVSVVATASAAVQLSMPYATAAVSISNMSATLAVAFKFGADNTVAAVLPTAPSTDGDMVVLPGSVVTVEVPSSTPWVSFIASGAGPTIVYATPGTGA